MNLDRLFRAQSVAIIGASERSYYARSVFENLGRLGFPAERIHLVNPNRAEAFGRPCAPRLEAPVDLAVVLTPTASVAGVVAECGRAGVGACVVLSDGFAETGPAGAALQRELAAAARDAGVVLVGPNTMGLVVPGPRLGVWGGALPEVRDGAIALVLQSSGLGNLLFGLLAYRRLGLRLAISVGNEAGLSLADALAFAVDDPATRVIALFVESVSDADAFRAALARADRLRKPIIALHVGRSVGARRNVIAHTGRLAASGEAWGALFAQHGVISVGNIDALVETIALFARAPGVPPGEGAGLLTISGGDCTLLSDLAERVGLSLPEPERRAELAAQIGKPTVLGNPLDVENLWRSDPAAFVRVVELFCRERFAVAAFRLNLPERPGPMRDAYTQVAAIARAANKLPVFLTRASEPLDPTWHALFDELGVPLLQEYERSLRAIAALLRHARRSRPEARAPRARGHRLPAGAGPLSHADTVALLSAYGIRFAPSEQVASGEAAAAAAQRLGYPVALKAWTAHKSDQGALRLGLRSEAEVRAAFAEVSARAPGAALIVQRMVTALVECIAGIAHDEQLGPVLLVGMGGVFAEAMNDTALRLPPISAADARAMLGELRGHALLEGARGRPAADVEALVDLLLHLSDLACEQRDRIAELDLNPVRVGAHSEGALAVDALVLRSAAVAAGSSAPVAASTTTR